LLAFCSAGRIYEIERWIQAGRPLQATSYDVYRRGRLQSPIEIAIAKALPDVALLLLCNGYRLDLETNAYPFATPLDQALQARAWGFVDVLLEWGADPRGIDPDSVFGTYRVDLMDRFWDAGLDFVKDHALAWYLSEHSSNRPLYGWAKRHAGDPRIARDLDLALLRAVNEKREKAVHLLLWTGANPRARVPMLDWMSRTRDANEEEEDTYSPIEHAAGLEHPAFLPLLKPDPRRDDFAALYAAIDHVEVLKHLHGIRPPDDWSPVIMRNIYRLGWPFGDHRDAKECLDFIAKQGGRLGTLPREQCTSLRGTLLKLPEAADLWKLLRWLSDPECCEAATFAEITRTPTMKAKLRRMTDAERQRRGW
jgi:hypothetical protein